MDLPSSYGWRTQRFSILPTRRDRIGFVMAAANAYGLALLVVFLGFGLVDIPMTWWQSGHPEARLRALELEAPRVQEELEDAQLEYNDVIYVRGVDARVDRSPDVHPGNSSYASGDGSDASLGAMDAPSHAKSTCFVWGTCPSDEPTFCVVSCARMVVRASALRTMNLDPFCIDRAAWIWKVGVIGGGN